MQNARFAELTVVAAYRRRPRTAYRRRPRTAHRRRPRTAYRRRPRTAYRRRPRTAYRRRPRTAYRRRPRTANLTITLFVKVRITGTKPCLRLCGTVSIILFAIFFFLWCGPCSHFLSAFLASFTVSSCRNLRNNRIESLHQNAFTSLTAASSM